jgi:hypothetical protein
VKLGAEEIFCLDRSKEFNELTQAFRTFPRTETLIVGDWMQTLSDMHGQFDLVLSDFTLGNLPYERQDSFLSLINASLKPSGYFADRLLTFRRPCHSYEALTEMFELAPSNLPTLNAFNAMWLFCGQRVEQSHLVDTSATYDWTSRVFTQPHIQWLASNCTKISPRGSVWYYGRPWAEVSGSYAKHFHIHAEYPEATDSPYYGWAFTLVSSPVR